jgi:TolA-binding protein
VSSVLGAPLLVLYADGAPKAQFLTPDQRARGEIEWARLTAMPAAPEYLATQTVAWVGSHPSDPHAPEALHLAVRAVRYGCATKAGTSKAAFQLLHSRYPDSEWARKTKYWY